MLIDPYRYAVEEEEEAEQGMFVAGGGGGTGPRIMYSLNGVTWDSTESPWDVSGEDISGLAFSRMLRRWVAVSNDNDGHCLTSENGTLWVEQTIPQNGWIDVCRAEFLGLYIAVSNIAGANSVMTSPDGITWTLQTLTGDLATASWTSVAASEEGEYVVAGGQAGMLMSSPDGINWTQRTHPSPIVVTFLVAQPGSNRVIGVSGGDGVFNIYTVDGITWNLNAHGLGTGLDGVGASPDLVIVTNPFSTVATEPDGIGPFTTRTHPGTHSWIAAAHSEELGLYAIIGSGGAGTENHAITSPDGITWTQRTTPADVEAIGWQRIAAGWQQPDEFFDDTFMLIHVNDGEIYERTGFPAITIVGDGVVTTDDSQFGDESFFNPGTSAGSTDYIRVEGDADDFTFPGEFTIEGWFRVKDYNDTFNNFFANNLTFPSAGFIQFAVRSDNEVVFFSGTPGFVTSNIGTYTPYFDVWTHLAVCRDADDNMYMFANGNLISIPKVVSGTFGGDVAGVSSLDVGRAHAGDNSDLNAYFQEIRVTKRCRYTTAFTPPSAPFEPFP
jgi:hypothetical protein